MTNDRDEYADAIDGLVAQLRAGRETHPARESRQLRISDLVALVSLGGMIYAFVSNQASSQTAVLLRLNQSEQLLNEVKKNSDQIPMLQYQMTELRAKQESTEKDRAEDRLKTQQIQETLLKMGLTLKAPK